ncbi:MAG: recombination mediator RecR [Verrucomicrobia bacterium]|jgi:recombination protein RecR|nr:recombination mediator RecR [Verrucomicrobiota bacterium]
MHMPGLPPPIIRLISALRRLPGVGPRSAERMALDLVQSPAENASELADAIREARNRTLLCSNCGSLTEADPCAFCTDERRDPSLICVVEQPVDVLSIERSGSYRGRFHVLGGRISPLDGIGPEDLKIPQLEQRLTRDSVKEVILAMGTDVEGEATCHYLGKRLARTGLKVSRIAHGLPVGAGLEFADELTLSRALEGRSEFTP